MGIVFTRFLSATSPAISLCGSEEATPARRNEIAVIKTGVGEMDELRSLPPSAVDWHKANVERMMESVSCLRRILDIMEDELERLHSVDPATLEEEELRANLAHIAARISLLAHAFQTTPHQPSTSAQ